MKQGRCYGCDRKSFNLLTANCGHKTCFQCVKVNKTSKRCSQCQISLNSNNAHHRKQEHSLGKSKTFSDHKVKNRSQQLSDKKSSHHRLTPNPFNLSRQRSSMRSHKKLEDLVRPEELDYKNNITSDNPANQQSSIVMTTRKNFIFTTIGNEDEIENQVLE